MSSSMVHIPTDWVYTIVLSVTAFVLTFIFLRERSYRTRLPPGPMAWPVIGNLPQIFGKDLHIVLTEMAKEYGSLVWLKMGGDKVLVINNMSAAVSSFVRQGNVFSGRPRKRKTVDVLLGSGRDIVMSDRCPELKFHRKIVHSFLASQTKSGKNRLESCMMREYESFGNKLERICKDGEAFDPKFHVARVVANVLCQCILNRRFDDVDESFHEQLRIIQDIVDNIESFNIVDVIPWLEHFPIPSWKRFRKSLKKRDEWITQLLEEHRASLDPENNRDLVDIMLNLQQKARETGDVEQLELLNDTNIGHIVHELFGGGIESTTMTVLWFIIYLIRNPEWQERIYEEICGNIDMDGTPSPFDRSKYPVLEATIKETLRMACVLPVGFPHRTMTDTQIDGHFVPNDTMVIMNIWAIHHDENAWKNPYSFNPARFLEESSSERYSYLPFGIGNRVCLGSNIAKMEAFMFCACLVSKFRFMAPDDESLPDTTGLSGLTMRPKPFRIKLEKRT